MAGPPSQQVYAFEFCAGMVADVDGTVSALRQPGFRVELEGFVDDGRRAVVGGAYAVSEGDPAGLCQVDGDPLARLVRCWLAHCWSPVSWLMSSGTTIPFRQVFRQSFSVRAREDSNPPAPASVVRCSI